MAANNSQFRKRIKNSNFFHRNVVSSFISLRNNIFEIKSKTTKKGDIANFNYLLGLKGASSNQPCPLCKMTRQVVTDQECRKDNKVKMLKNYDEFYQKGEPRLLSDWDTETSSQMNPVLRQLMIVSGIDKIDEILIPGSLHNKLRKEFHISILEFFSLGIENLLNSSKFQPNIRKRDKPVQVDHQLQVQD